MKEQLITLEEYEKLPQKRIRTGIISNSPSGCFLTRNKRLSLLKYVVVKRIEGWVVYFGTASQSAWDIELNGDKAHTEDYIRRCLPCTDEVFKLYVL